eukprot:3940438-Rhodomonas_salina.2
MPSVRQYRTARRQHCTPLPVSSRGSVSDRYVAFCAPRCTPSATSVLHRALQARSAIAARTLGQYCSCRTARTDACAVRYCHSITPYAPPTRCAVLIRHLPTRCAVLAWAVPVWGPRESSMLRMLPESCICARSQNPRNTTLRLFWESQAPRKTDPVRTNTTKSALERPLFVDAEVPKMKPGTPKMAAPARFPTLQEAAVARAPPPRCSHPLPESTMRNVSAR